MIRFNPSNENIHYRPRLAVLALPMVMLTMTIKYLGYYMIAVASFFGVAPHARFQPSVASIMALVCALSLAFLILFIAALFGWLLNGVVLRFVFKWPTAKIIRFLIHLETPPEWLIGNGDTQSNNDE